MTDCPVCVARRRKHPTKLDDDTRTCRGCRYWLNDTLDTIWTLAANATCEPGSGRTGTGHTIPGSRPPIRLDGVDPALTLVDIGQGRRLPLLEVLEEWERTIRGLRGFTPYGPASVTRLLDNGWNDTTATLSGVIRFLTNQTDWATTDQDFPIGDYAREIAACRRVLARWDNDHEPRPALVPCPTITVDGPCTGRLRLGHTNVQCPRCKHERTEDELVRLATADNQPPDVWVDAEAAASAAGVHERTVRRWAATGRITAHSGRYRLLDVLPLRSEDTRTRGA